jgi:hypothetical protein
VDPRKVAMRNEYIYDGSRDRHLFENIIGKKYNEHSVIFVFMRWGKG